MRGAPGRIGKTDATPSRRVREEELSVSRQEPHRWIAAFFQSSAREHRHVHCHSQRQDLRSPGRIRPSPARRRRRPHSGRRRRRRNPGGHARRVRRLGRPRPHDRAGLQRQPHAPHDEGRAPSGDRASRRLEHRGRAAALPRLHRPPPSCAGHRAPRHGLESGLFPRGRQPSAHAPGS